MVIKSCGAAMVTERYIISFYGIDTKYYTNEFVGKCWEIAADEVYRERQVYVTGSVLTTNIICGEVRGLQSGQYRSCDHIGAQPCGDSRWGIVPGSD